MTEQEIEIQMKKAAQKVPYEIKKIKILLALVKFFKKIKSIFCIRRSF